MKILIIEDNKSTVAALHSLLKAENYEVSIAYDGIDGIDKLSSGIFDCALLDINLPRLDGFSVLNHVKRKQIKTNIIILTAYDDIDSRLKGLTEGAIDYIIKPFDSRELIARIKLRNNIFIKQNSYSYSNTFLNPATYALMCNDNSIKLTKKEFQILEKLFLSPETIITRDALLGSVWSHDEFVDSRNLDVYISIIRRKLTHIGSNAVIITKKSVGYMLEVQHDS